MSYCERGSFGRTADRARTNKGCIEKLEKSRNGALRRELPIDSRPMCQKQVLNTGKPSEDTITARPITELVRGNYADL